MATQCSSRPSRSNINECQQNQRYKELTEMISEWTDLHYNKKGFLKIDKKQTYRKYKVIRDMLVKNFKNDDDLKELINRLPKLWIVHPRLIPAVFISSMIGLIFCNEYFLKIFTGITISGKSSEVKVDIIYVLFAVVMAVAWIFLAQVMDKKITLENIMNKIYRIAFRKANSLSRS